MSKYNWNKASELSNWIFTDQDGDVFESNIEPDRCDNGWRGTGDCEWTISCCSPFKGDWKDSLEQRPVEKN